MEQQRTIQKNFAYKSALTLSHYIMAFITFPYVSRVLGVERIGLVNFVDNTLSYFLLFATMGVNLLGVREIAAVKGDIVARNKVFSRIFGMNLCFTALAIVAYIIFILLESKTHQYSILFYIGVGKLIFTAFVIEWFFTGLENFRYIALRSLAVEILYVLTVFCFIKNEGDYRLYFILTISTIAVNACVNFGYAFKFIHISFKELFSIQYLKQNVILGIYGIMSSMYLTFNVMFLGLVTTTTHVGYYTTAYKVYSVVLGLFSAFTNVMMPRMSALLANGDKECFNELIEKSFRIMCMSSVPMIVCTVILAPQIIYILSGVGYEGAITPMRIIMPAALFVGIAQVLAIQILTPMRKDKILFFASLIGAIISIILNVSLISHFQSVGSALVLLCAEIVVTTTYIVYVEKHHLIKIPFKSIWHNILLSIPAAGVCILCKAILMNPFVIVAVAVPSAFVVWYLIYRGVIRKKFV